METIRKLKVFIGIYGVVLLLLLLCVCTTPLLIRRGLAASAGLMIEEEVLETILIVVLFAVSCFLLRGLLRTLSAYRQAADQTARENATLLSRLADAFQYIGTVNVEIQEIQSVLCGIDCFPRSRREWRRCLKGLAAETLTITGAPWAVVRVIDPGRCRTLKECAVERSKGRLPTATVGNRDILEGRRIEGLAAVSWRPKNLALMMVAVLPPKPLSEAEELLVRAILYQFALLYLIWRCGNGRCANLSAE